jgi:molybdopterin synthase sulfur carrier subunit
MAVSVYVAGYLTSFTNGNANVILEHAPSSVGEALGMLYKKHPGLRDRIITEQGQLRPHVNVFVGETNVRNAAGFETPLTADSEMCILPAVSGG